MSEKCMQPAEVTDAEIDALCLSLTGFMTRRERDRAVARAILAMRPVQVPMTDEQRNDMICTVTTLCAKLSRQAIAGMAIDWTEAHHGITAQGKKEGA